MADASLIRWSEDYPQFAVPYEPGVVNRVDRAAGPPLPVAAGGIDRPIPRSMRPAPPEPYLGIDALPPRAHPADIGAGIPVAPSMPVSSVDLPPGPANVNPQSIMQMLSGFGGGGGGARFGTPMAGAPASSRYSSTRPEFIYTNPAAAAQAASNYQARLNFEAAQDQGYRDYLSRLNTADSAERSEIGRQAAISREAEANRALQREGYATNERIAGAAESARQQQFNRLDWQRRRDAFQQGLQYAEMQNRNPSAKVPAGLTYQGADGRWRPAIADPGPDLSTPAAPIEDINAVRSRIPAPPSSVVSIERVPSPGPRAPAPTDFRVPVAPLQ